MSKKKKHPQRRVSCKISYAILFLMFIPFCVCSWMFFANDFLGTIHEKLVRYPDSQLIWMGYGVYGTGDYGIKVYYHWTSDMFDVVNDYYQQVRLSWKPDLIEMAELNTSNRVVCWWAGFNRTDGCEKLKEFSQRSYGTLIIFEHDYFEG